MKDIPQLFPDPTLNNLHLVEKYEILYNSWQCLSFTNLICPSLLEVKALKKPFGVFPFLMVIKSYRTNWK